MERKRANADPLMLENRSMHGSTQNDPLYPHQFPSLEPKICKLLPDLPFSLSPDYKFSGHLKQEFLDLWPDISTSGPGSQSEVQNTNHSGAGLVIDEPESSNESTEAPSACSPSTSQTPRRAKNFSDYNAMDDVTVVDLSDSPNSQNSYASEEDADVVILGTTRREPRMDGSVVCLDNDDPETDNSLQDGDHSDIKSITLSQDTADAKPSTTTADLSSHSQLAGNDDSVSGVCSKSHRTTSKLAAMACFEKQKLSQEYEKTIETKRAMIETLRAEIKVQKQNYEWQEAKIRYLETKLQERNDFEYKLEAVNQVNDMLEKKLTDLEKSASNLPFFERELKRLREKTKLLEEDKRSKEELGQTISNLIDDKANLKTENESLTSIAGMLEKENSTLKQKCETLEKAAEKATICTGDNMIAENCCIRSKEIRDRVTESLENEFKCSICEEVFIEATVTNCNHVFCAHCLSEWMKKKKDCPYCRKHVTQQCRAPVIDEYVLTMCKTLSEKMHADRLQVVQERKTISSKKVPQQTSRKSAVRVVPIANLRQIPTAPRSLTHLQSYMRGGMTPVPATGVGSFYDYVAPQLDDLDYFSSVYANGASSTATASATSAMSSTASSTATAPAAQMHPLDARISRSHSYTAQATATAPSSMHVSSTSSTAPAAPLPAATTASSTASNMLYSNSWGRAGIAAQFDALNGFLSNSTMYNNSRPTIAAVNPFSSMDEAPQRAPSTAVRSATTTTSSSRFMFALPGDQ